MISSGAAVHSMPADAADDHNDLHAWGVCGLRRSGESGLLDSGSCKSSGSSGVCRGRQGEEWPRSKVCKNQQRQATSDSTVDTQLGEYRENTNGRNRGGSGIGDCRSVLRDTMCDLATQPRRKLEVERIESLCFGRDEK